MVNLHIFLEPLAGEEENLEVTFRSHFVPAVSAQDGFINISLLRPHDSLRTYVVSFAFENEEKRQKWAVSDAHENSFPKLCALCSSVRWRNHDVILTNGKQ